MVQRYEKKHIFVKCVPVRRQDMAYNYKYNIGNMKLIVKMITVAGVAALVSSADLGAQDKDFKYLAPHDFLSAKKEDGR